MDKVCEQNDDLKEWAKEVSEFLTEEINVHEQKADRGAQRNLVTQFLPNLAHVFMRSFSLLQGERPPDSLYEYGVLVTMYFNFFQIPYALFRTLQSVIADPWIVLGTGTMILGMAVGLLYSYLRWFKGCPSRIIHCDNWTEQYSHKLMTRVIGRDHEYATVKDCLDAGQAVLVHGVPGVGKTEFMKGLSIKFPEYRFFCFKNGEIFSTGSWSASTADKIVESFQDAAGHQQIVFCLDEFGDTFTSSKNDLKAVLKPLLGDNYKKIRFIAATTSDQWQKICAEDSAVDQRFHKIHLEPTTAEQTTAILFEQKRFLEKRIPISKKAIKKIVTLCGENLKQAQPRNGVNTLKYLASHVALFKPETYMSKELRAAKEQVDLIRLTGNRHKDGEVLKAAKAKVAAIEVKVQAQRQLAATLMKLYQLRYAAEREFERLIWKIAKDQEVTTHDKVKLMCLEKLYVPQLKQRIKKLMPELDEEIHLRLDSKLVESYFTEIQQQSGVELPPSQKE